MKMPPPSASLYRRRGTSSSAQSKSRAATVILSRRALMVLAALGASVSFPPTSSSSSSSPSSWSSLLSCNGSGGGTTAVAAAAEATPVIGSCGRYGGCSSDRRSYTDDDDAIFAMGLVLGTHMVMTPTPTNTENVVSPPDPSAVHDAAKISVNDLVLRSAALEAARRKEEGENNAAAAAAPGAGTAGAAGGFLHHLRGAAAGLMHHDPNESPPLVDQAAGNSGSAGDKDGPREKKSLRADQHAELDEDLDEIEMNMRLADHQERFDNPIPFAEGGMDEVESSEKEEAFGKIGSDFPATYLGEHVPENYDFTSYKPLGGDRFSEWKDGDTPYAITQSLREASDALARTRREHVKKAMQHAWNGYKKHAFGQDELLPVTKRGHNNWGGMGTTLVDSLDTLWLMGLKDDFWMARDWVRDHLVHTYVGTVSVFETTIRSLGGLLSAYDWSGDKVFLDKADDLGKRLIKAFDTPSGLPYGQVNLHNQAASNLGWTGGNAILAEVGTVQVEFRYLTKATGNKEYAKKAELAFETLRGMNPPDGLYPYFIRNKNENPTFANEKITFGAMGDSVYEYMLKLWLQGGKKEPLYRAMYDKSIQGMHDRLLQKSTPSGLTYIADSNNGQLHHKMDHLVCFMGGLLALGAYTDPQGLQSARAQRDLKTGKQLAYTCYQMYARMNTGISPEFVRFESGNDFKIGESAPFYILRPETVESFYVLNQLTGDPIYREWGWEIFMSIERFCKTEIAYGSLHDVSNTNGRPEDRMESFFLAETMKYLYLLQDPDSEVNIMQKHVFNTEAHPLRMFPVIDKEDGDTNQEVKVAETNG